jgi:hypothetical protein
MADYCIAALDANDGTIAGTGLMTSIYRDVVGFLLNMDAQECLFALIALAAAGLIFLRGFGSRSSY